MAFWLKFSRWANRPPTKGCRLCLVFAFCAAVLTLGCHGRADSSPGVVITHELAPEPARVGAAMITLHLKDAAARPLTGAHIVVEAVMSHPGMAPIFADAKELGLGQYRAELRFTMAGDWVVLLHLRLANGQRLEREIKVSGVKAE
jgi:YtkA-like protein